MRFCLTMGPEHGPLMMSVEHQRCRPCSGRDSNPQAFRHTSLSRARIPVPPPEREHRTLNEFRRLRSSGVSQPEHGTVGPAAAAGLSVCWNTGGPADDKECTLGATTTDTRGATDLAGAARLYALLFSAPYVWAFTGGLPLTTRLAAVIAHACTLFAACAFNDTVDCNRGHRMHLGLVPNPVIPALVRPAGWVLAGIALLAGFALWSVTVVLPLAVVMTLVVAWLMARLPAERKYLFLPESASPVACVLLPAALFALYTNAQVVISTAIAGTSFLAALVIAAHIRDRDVDYHARIPTIATRNLTAARGWLLTAGVLATIAACASLDVPLSFAEVLRGIGALAFGAGTAIAYRRVTVLAAAHAIFALSLLL